MRNGRKITHPAPPKYWRYIGFPEYPDYCTCCGDFFNHEASDYEGSGDLWPVRTLRDGLEYGHCAYCLALLNVLDYLGNECDIIKFKPGNCIGLFAKDSGIDLVKLHQDVANMEQRVFRLTMEGTPSSQQEFQAEAKIHSSSKSQECLEWVQERIRTCEKLHNCWDRTVFGMPTRVLEIRDGRLWLRLNVQPQDYATLSHCWGSASFTTGNLKLMSGSITRFITTGIAFDELCATFRDAADFSHRLGINYIWIDSLCIIQDDPNDWERESSRMADVYSNAYIGLFAGHASNGGEGLYSDRAKEEFGHDGALTLKCLDGADSEMSIKIELQHRIAHDLTFSRHSDESAPTLGNGESPTAEQPLFRRGWVFQELNLSLRAVLFNRQELVWVCNEDVACECGRTTKDDYRSKYMFQKVPQVSDYPHAQQGDLLFKHGLYNWAALIRVYSTLGLTFEKDRLPALSGMAKYYQLRSSTEMKDDLYLAGLWKSMLPEALLWQSIDAPPSGPVRRCRFRHDVKERGNPTWSWASSDYQVELHNDWFDCKYFVQVEDVQCVTRGHDQYGEVATGYLVLRAIHLEEVELVKVDQAIKSKREEARDMRDTYMRNSDTEMLRCRVKRDVKFSFLPDYDVTDQTLGSLFIPTSETLYCMPVVGMGDWPFSEISLILRRHERTVEFSDTPDVAHLYERVGYCKGQIMFQFANDYEFTDKLEDLHLHGQRLVLV
ncbi:heterokaryon incompatibility protein-domain-containing protein [Xylariales sp. AK1849]|nr:heterokaryon incompatibility protein-domain-containing protein [Xylariales sp. AK1849]